MQLRFRHSIAIVGSVVLVGCTGAQKVESPASVAPTSQPKVDRTETVRNNAQEYAVRVQNAIDRQPAPAPEIRWLPPLASPEPVVARKPAPVKSAQLHPTTPVKEAPKKVEPPAKSTVIEKPAKPKPPNRDELIAQLRKLVGTGKDPAVVKAITYAALSLADPNQAFDSADAGKLSAAQQKTVERYHRLITELARQIASSDVPLTRDEVDRHLDVLFGKQPLTIRRTEMCRRVRGYGVYEPFDSTTFLVGRDQPMILYVELDNFKVVKSSTDSKLNQVLLTQEITLYSASDGLKVWHHEPVRILDESRNVRRDFFVVQKIVLPRTLNVGKYRLKIRARDLNGDTVDETIVPIDYVADPKLAGGVNK